MSVFALLFRAAYTRSHDRYHRLNWPSLAAWEKNSKHSTSRTERNVKENMEEVSYFNGEPSLTAITEVQYQRYSK